VPIQKFRSIAEMNAAPVLTSDGERGFDRFLRHCARVHAMAPVRFRPGVVKFRSVEEAERSRTHRQ
jgi:hypothetical protein